MKRLARWSPWVIPLVVVTLPQTIGRQWVGDYLWKHPESIGWYSRLPAVFLIGAIVLWHIGVWLRPHGTPRFAVWALAGTVFMAGFITLFTMISRHGRDLTDAFPELEPGVFQGFGMILVAFFALWIILALGPPVVTYVLLRVRAGTVCRVVGSQSFAAERIRVIYRPTFSIGMVAEISVDGDRVAHIRPGEAVGLALSPGWHKIVVATPAHPPYARLRARVRVGPGHQTVLGFSGSWRTRLKAWDEPEVAFRRVNIPICRYSRIAPTRWARFALTAPIKVDESTGSSHTSATVGPQRSRMESLVLTIPGAALVGVAIGLLAWLLPTPSDVGNASALWMLIDFVSVFAFAWGVVEEVRRRAAFTPVRDHIAGVTAIGIGACGVIITAMLLRNSVVMTAFVLGFGLVVSVLVTVGILVAPRGTGDPRGSSQSEPGVLDRYRFVRSAERAEALGTRIYDWSRGEPAGSIRLQFSTIWVGKATVTLSGQGNRCSTTLDHVPIIVVSPGRYTLSVKVGQFQARVPVEIRRRRNSAVWIGIVRPVRLIPWLSSHKPSIHVAPTQPGLAETHSGEDWPMPL